MRLFRFTFTINAFMLKALLRQPRRSLFITRLTPVLLLLVCLIVFAASVNFNVYASASWTKQKSNTLAWLHAVYFLDAERGWAAGGNGALLSTTDGGATWRTLPRPTTDALRDVYFADKDTGWLVCERNLYQLKTNDEARTYLLRTTNGGTTWQRIDVAGARPDERFVRAFFSKDGAHGWVFGEAGALYATRDGGENWARQAVPTRRLLLGGAFIDADTGWLVGAGANIMQTIDGGETWEAANVAGVSPGSRLNAVAFVDKSRGWAAGAQGLILFTTNGGRTWRKQISGVATDLYDVKFMDAAEGWAIGAEGVLLHTTNGGAQWTLERSGTTHPLERLCLAGRTRAFAVGFGGTIIRFDADASNSQPHAPQLKSVTTH